jgi:hypothetical protein
LELFIVVPTLDRKYYVKSAIEYYVDTSTVTDLARDRVLPFRRVNVLGFI